MSPYNQALHGGVVVPAQALLALRQGLEQAGQDPAALMQAAGFATGAHLLQSFASWLGEAHGLTDPAQLDQALLDPVLSEFLTALGWGTVTVHALGHGLVAVDSHDWAEAAPGTATWPSCHLSSGMIASFLGQLGGQVLGALEVECRSRGDARCRFIAGDPDNLHTLYDRLANGASLDEVLNG
ncbi:MAG TPA: V4R domain-containing protein [Gemmatimonadales bacterium]|jgi:predicted hydrocarbon binding protein|nr:V4R domain-containing protein [Gemmatimonadales bacterium]